MLGTSEGSQGSNPQSF